MCASTLAPKGPVPNAVAAVFATLLRRNAHFCPRPSSRQSCRKLRPDAAILGPSNNFKSSDSAWGVSRNGSRSPWGSAVLGPTRPSSFSRHSPRETTTFARSKFLQTLVPHKFPNLHFGTLPSPRGITTCGPLTGAPGDSRYSAARVGSRPLWSVFRVPTWPKVVVSREESIQT